MVDPVLIASIILIIGTSVVFSVIRLIRAFYSDTARSIQLIRLGKNSIKAFILILSMNIIFTLGFLLQFIGVYIHAALISNLIYVVGVIVFLSLITNTLLKKYNLN